MVTDREPWSALTATYLLELIARDVPLLGVCYGHQLLADALGGRVENNPRGRSVGSFSLTLHPEAKNDVLFSVLPDGPVLHVRHRQSVVRLPEGAVCLAASPRDPHHAFRVGKRAWGVQFHPEFDAAIAREYIVARREIIEAEGEDPEALLAAVQESDAGRVLLRRFADLVG
jgi:GMP synthase (glutamine-hydrolysing)